MRKFVVSAIVVVALLVATIAFAHHGSAVSYHMDQPWTSDAVVVEFSYINPHPTLIFERKNEKGELERWDSELFSNPSQMMRSGWTAKRSNEALKPGTKVKLTLATSKANVRSAAVTAIQNEAGEYIVLARGGRGGGGGQGQPGGGAGQPQPGGGGQP